MQVDKKYTTTSAKKTQKLGQQFALEILNTQGNEKAIVIGLSGNLGGGKTTFLQGFARGLGIGEKILSPTFVILKRFTVKKTSKNFYHFDCYRTNKPEEILDLDFKKIISDVKNIVAIEWPEKINKFLPEGTILIYFKFIDKNPDGGTVEDPRRSRDKREIKFKI